MGISACIIAKNEAENITRCITSLKGAVDEIIVVDTGSTDNTIALAKDLGAFVYTMEWQEDFSKARNYSLDKAKEEWALIIDCDEELDNGSVDLLRDLSTSKDFEGFGVIVSNVIGGQEAYAVQSLRFIRNKKEYRFHEPIHEQVGDVIVSAKGPYAVLSSKVKFIHYGYEVNPEMERLKTERNLGILNSVPQESRDSLYYLHLGNEYVRMEDYKEAKRMYLKSKSLATIQTPHYTQLCHKLIDVLVKLKDFKSGLMYSNVMLKDFPDFKALLFLNAICNIENKNYPKALEALLRFKETPPSLSKYPNVDYESSNDIEGIIQQLKFFVYGKQLIENKN